MMMATGQAQGQRELLKRVARVNARLQVQGFRAYLRDMLPTPRARVEAERMLDAQMCGEVGVESLIVPARHARRPWVEGHATSRRLSLPPTS